MPDKLSDDEVQERLRDLVGWDLVDGKLHRDYKFANFVDAMGFIMRAGIEAEKMNHHPEWFNVYNKVNVDLTTHSAGGITQLDFELAAKMNKLAGVD
jgi:4a-hydroxytetrahydrobiopterin dehydratase